MTNAVVGYPQGVSTGGIWMSALRRVFLSFLVSLESFGGRVFRGLFWVWLGPGWRGGGANGWYVALRSVGALVRRLRWRGGYRCVVSGNAGPLVTNRIAEFLIMRAPTDFPIGVSQSSTLIVLEEHFH